MMTLLQSQDRGHVNFGWLDSHHSFSFGDYYNPERMGFRALRVINEDRIEGGSGFPTHPHRDMEIISYVIEGALEHRDTMGNSTVIQPGEVQRMSAGTGIRHSEFNHFADRQTHFLQIWILPDKQGYSPEYSQKSFVQDFQTKSLVLVLSPDGEEGSIAIHQDLRLFIGKFKSGEERHLSLEKNRHVWVQVIKGAVMVNGQKLKASDGAGLSGESDLQIQSTGDAEFLLFDMA